MILDALTLHNFGVYAGRQTLTLTPPQPERPVILVGGLNGGGKTTLLDAIRLVLFGPFAQCSNRQGTEYYQYLAGCIHGGVSEATLALTFRHTLDGVESEYRLQRSWRLTGRSCKETFEVIRDGSLDRALTDNWANQVEDFIPKNIAHLFLFDGEQLEGYASPDSSAQLIETAIHNLLGLDVVDRLERDLVTFERRKQTQAKADREREAIEQAERAVESARHRLDELKQERASLQTHQLERARSRLAEVEERYRQAGGDLYDRQTDIEARQREVEAALEQSNAALQEAAAGPLPLLLVSDWLTAVAQRDADEEHARHEREVLGALADRDAALLEHLQQQQADPALLESLQSFCDRDRGQRAELVDCESYLELSSPARADLQFLQQQGLDETRESAASALQEHARWAQEAERLRLEAASVPTSDEIAAIAQEREQLQNEIAQTEREIERLDGEIASQERALEREQQALTQRLEADAQAQLRRDDRGRMLHHASKARGTLAQFRQAVVRQHLERIEQLVLESYQQLLHKQSLVTQLRIDPERFHLTLFDRNGAPLSADDLSAGERQLLAVALLWGLAKASGRPLPTAIDTPLGRLDTSHRSHLVQRYFPYASHQVLLLSTDEEIAGEYWRQLEPWIGRSYQLAFDDAAGATTVRSGYFHMQEAA